MNKRNNSNPIQTGGKQIVSQRNVQQNKPQQLRNLQPQKGGKQQNQTLSPQRQKPNLRNQPNAVNARQQPGQQGRVSPGRNAKAATQRAPPVKGNLSQPGNTQKRNLPPNQRSQPLTNLLKSSSQPQGVGLKGKKAGMGKAMSQAMLKGMGRELMTPMGTHVRQIEFKPHKFSSYQDMQARLQNPMLEYDQYNAKQPKRPTLTPMGTHVREKISTTHSYKSFKEVSDKSSKLKMGGLGANIGSEEWTAQQEKLQKRKEYAEALRKQLIKSPPAKATRKEKPPAKIQNTAPDSDEDSSDDEFPF